jgi:hypothetical protein
MKLNFKLKKKNLQYIGFSIIMAGLLFVIYSFFSYQFNEYSIIEGYTTQEETEYKKLDDLGNKRTPEDNKKFNELKKKKKIRDDNLKEDIKNSKELKDNIKDKILSIDENIQNLKNNMIFPKNKDVILKYVNKIREEKTLKHLDKELEYINDKSDRIPFSDWYFWQLGDLESLLVSDVIRPSSEYS